MSVRCAVVVQFGIAEAEMIFQGVIFGGGKFAVQLVGANVGRILVADAALIKSFVSNCQGELTGLGGGLADSKSVFADEVLGFKTDKLHDDAGFAHRAVEALPRPAA